MNPKIYLLNLCFFCLHMLLTIAIHPRDSQMKGSQTNPLNNVHCLSLFPCLLPHPTLSPSCPNCQPPLSHVEEWGWRVPFSSRLSSWCDSHSRTSVHARISRFLRRSRPGVSRNTGNTRDRPLQQVREDLVSHRSDTRKAPQVREVGSKLSQLIRHQWPALLSGIGVVVAVSVLQYGGLIWCSVLLQKKGTDSVTGMQNFVFFPKKTTATTNNKQQTTNNNNNKTGGVSEGVHWIRSL